MVASSDKWPSEVLASLLEYCLPGEEETAFLRAAFTMRLPRTIHVHLAGMELTDLKELAQRADRLWLCHAPQTVAAIQVEEDQQEEDSRDVVAAMAAKKRPNFKQGQQAAGKWGKSLCWVHKKFGEDCYRCTGKKNCTWLGN